MHYMEKSASSLYLGIGNIHCAQACLLGPHPQSSIRGPDIRGESKSPSGPASVTQHWVQLPMGPARSSDSVRGPCPELYTSDVPAHHEHYKSRFTKEHVCLGWVPGLGILVSQLTRPSHGKGSTRLALDPWNTRWPAPCTGGNPGVWAVAGLRHRVDVWDATAVSLLSLFVLDFSYMGVLNL